MLSMKDTGNERLAMLETLIRYAEESGNDKPQFTKKDILKRMGMCEHVFNKLHRQIGNKCLHEVDRFDETVVYAINVNQCMGLHNRLIMESNARTHRECVEKKVLATLIGTFALIVFVL